jgi:spore germination protein GerM
MTLWALAVCALIIIAAILLREFLSGGGALRYGSGYQPTEPVETTTVVTLLFGSTDGEGLVPEQTQVRKRNMLLDQIREVIEELIRGPRGVLVRTIPEGTKLLSAYMLQDGTLVVDFSREIQTLHTGGSTGEIMTVYSIVNTLTMNFKEVERVQILVDGDEVETLVGHLDLEQPLTRDNRWLKSSFPALPQPVEESIE